MNMATNAAREHPPAPQAAPPTVSVLPPKKNLRLLEQQPQADPYSRPSSRHQLEFHHNRHTDSPLQPPPAHAPRLSQTSYLPHPRDMPGTPFEFQPQAAHQAATLPIINQGSTNPIDIYGRQAQQPPGTMVAPPPNEFVLPNLESYPVVWQGFLGLKTEYATVQFHYVSGCKELARVSLPTVIPQPEMTMPTLRIQQRMRLEEEHLNGVSRKMNKPMEHCILLALPCGKDTKDVELQSKHLRSHFITYLQLKSAAGIVNIPGTDQDNSFVVHVFPSCDFANVTMGGIAPDLLARVAEIEHMVIIIATTT